MTSKILMHVCCAPCAAPSLELVRQDRWPEIIFFYSNSNIYPREEFDLRLEHVRHLAAAAGVPLIEDEYDHDAWLEAVKGFESEPERGERCRRCFEFNLRRAAATAGHGGAFTTTLTVSPHKDNRTIFAAAAALPGFIGYDFKCNNGFRRGLELARQYGFYRQNYCGCEFSLRDRRKKRD